MVISKEKMQEMEKARDKCSSFINLNSSIKKQHFDEVAEYLDRFIKFPALASIVSVVFAQSDFVKNDNLSIWGMIFVLASSVIALNIFRAVIQKDKFFIEKIKLVEYSMIEFARKLTVFSRDASNADKESDLLAAYKDFEESYEEDHLRDYSEDISFIYQQINLSFGLMLLGIILSVLSLFDFCLF